MNVKSHVALGVSFVLLMAVGSYHGNRLDDLHESELFFRWLVNGSTQMRLEGTLILDNSSDLPDALDDVLFKQVIDEAEAFLPEFSIDPEEDYDAGGNLHPKLVRGARLEEDWALWRFATDAGTEGVKTAFLDAVEQGQIQSIGTQLKISDIYGGGEQVYGVGASSFLFGFRTLAANFVWLQVDKYWHEGSMHRMVPLMKTCVTLDPHFVDAFLLGAWHLAYNITAKLPDTPQPLKKWNERYRKRLGYKEEWYYVAIDFLRDGVLKNPRDYRVYFDLGYGIYENKLADHANAVRYLDEARRHRHDKWVPRMLYLAMMRNGQHEDAIAGWNSYLKRFPDNLSAPRFLQVNEAFLHEIYWEEARECATAAEQAAVEARQKADKAQDEGDAAALAKWLALAEGAESTRVEMTSLAETEQASAVAIWQLMYEVSEDPLAHARILRIRAMELAAEERYWEALAELDLARWENADLFTEASDLIIEYKRLAGEQLSVSEQTYVQRQMEALEAIALDKELGHEPDAPFRMPRRVACEYIEDASAAEDVGV